MVSSVNFYSTSTHPPEFKNDMQAYTVDMQAGKHCGVGSTGNSKQSSVACRDNHCKAPLSHSLRIKPTGLICGPTEYSHTSTNTHTTHTHTDASQHLHNTWTTLALLYFPFLIHAFHFLSLCHSQPLAHFCSH